MKNSSPRLEQQNLLVGSEMHTVLSTTPPLFLKKFAKFVHFHLQQRKKRQNTKSMRQEVGHHRLLSIHLIRQCWK